MQDTIKNKPVPPQTKRNKNSYRSEGIWSVKSTGKLFFAIGFSLLFYIALALLILAAVLDDHSITVSDLWKILLMPLVIAPLFYIVWLAVVPGMIFRKKIPLQVEIKPYQAGVTLIFPRKKQIRLGVDRIAFCFHRKSLHNVLIFYKIVPSRSGRLVFQKITTLIGLPVGSGWKKETLSEIANFLHQNGYQYHKEKDKNLFLRFME